MGIFTLIVAATTNYAIALSALIVIGFGGGFMAVPLNAYLQEEPAADEKGRMLATNNLMNSVAMAVAYGMLGVMHDVLHWSPRTIFGALGLVTLIAAVVVTRMMPAIVVRFVLAIMANLLFKIEITGAENIPKSGAALLVSNHISYADAVLAGYGTRRFVRFLMWKPIYEVPFARPVFEILKAIPVDSASPKIAVRALRTAHEELLNGKLVGHFSRRPDHARPAKPAPSNAATNWLSADSIAPSFPYISADSGAIPSAAREASRLKAGISGFVPASPCASVSP